MTVPTPGAPGVAVVTGGARGIGLGIASQLAKAGYRVVIVDTGGAMDGTGREPATVERAAQQLSAAGHLAEAAVCDVSDWAAVQALATDVVDRLGPVEVVVNAAGILRPGPFLDDTEDRWAAVLAVHLGGHLNVTRAFLPGLLERRRGHLVNVTSTSGLFGSGGHPAYSVAKEAVVGLTRYLGERLQGTGVSVNAVAPGAWTRMTVDPAGSPPTSPLGMYGDRDPELVGQFVRALVRDDPQPSGRVYLATGRYIAGCDHLRVLKWASLGPAPHDLQRVFEHALHRPNPREISPRPTRDFSVVERDRYWEGVAAPVPETVRTAADGQDDPPVTVVGPVDDGRVDQVVASLGRTQRLATSLTPAALRASGHRPSTAAVAVVPAPSPGPAAEADHGVAGGPEDTARVCQAVVDMMRSLQLAIAATGPQPGAVVTLLLPGWLPWRTPDLSVVGWLLWYATIGAARAGGAMQPGTGVSVNALTTSGVDGEPLGGLLEALSTAGRTMFNGWTFAATEHGVGVLRDELPLWQVFAAGDEIEIPYALLGSVG
jgi:NAD(P)-dependent dehydrogenase (short-subunit alcohol dehydrogenase family)